ncbi:glutamate ligase domain-containing protein [Kitasatospora sp. NPDC001664]
MATSTETEHDASIDLALAVPQLLQAPHLAGATDPGMEGLALWLAGAGADVTGSVRPGQENTEAAERLRAAGVSVRTGYDSSHVDAGRSAVVWSGVTVGPHPELDRAQGMGLTVLSRALALKAISAHAGREVLMVGGTHSTTTAAAVLAAALDDGKTGWILTAPARGSTVGRAAVGRLVADVCADTDAHEAVPLGGWQRRPAPTTPVTPKPSIVLITGVGENAPHHESIVDSLDAAERLARTATTVVLPLRPKQPHDPHRVKHAHDPLRFLHERLSDRSGPAVVTVGTGEDADVRITVAVWNGAAFQVALNFKDELRQFELRVTGRHHMVMACAAVTAALLAGEAPDTVAERLAAFEGVERSLVELGSQAGVEVWDSRARHPSEIARDVLAARELTDRSVIAVLEPNGYARASTHTAELAEALASADHIVLLPVTTPLAAPALPDPNEEIAALLTKQEVPGRQVARARFGPCEPVPARQVARLAEPGDLVLVIGTGPEALRLGPDLLFHLGAPTMPIPPQL